MLTRVRGEGARKGDESLPAAVDREIKGLCRTCDNRVHYAGERFCPRHGGKAMDPEQEAIVDEFIRMWRQADGDTEGRLHALRTAHEAISRLEP